MAEIHINGELVVVMEYTNGLLISIPGLGKCAGGSDEMDEFYNAQKLESVGIESTLAKDIAKEIRIMAEKNIDR